MRKNCCDMARKADKSVESGYPVEFVNDAFASGAESMAALLERLSGGRAYRILLAADQNVVQHTDGLGVRIGKFVQDHGIRLVNRPIILPGGEKIKTDSFQTAARVAFDLLEAKLGKDDFVFALGGGSLFDVVGWAAAQVRGGVRVVRLPTTAGAMVDAAFSTHSSLDAANVKDAFRIPTEPAAVVIDTSFLTTVLDGVWRGGMAETVRIATASDGALVRKIARNVSTLADRDQTLMAEVVETAVKARRKKKGIDGFALWSALRLEAMSGFKLPHGYAVAIGMMLEVAYASRRGLIDDAAREQVQAALAACGAIDILAHSGHLLSQVDSIMVGLDAWRLATGSSAVSTLGGVGKLQVEEEPDTAAYRAALADCQALARQKEPAPKEPMEG